MENKKQYDLDEYRIGREIILMLKIYKALNPDEPYELDKDMMYRKYWS